MQSWLQKAHDKGLLMPHDVVVGSAIAEVVTGGHCEPGTTFTEQDLLDAETNRASAVNDRFIAAYALMASMGKLTVDQLNLGIVSYDPAAYYESVKNAPRLSDRGLKLDKVLKSLGKSE